MSTIIEECMEETCSTRPHTIADYGSEMPRWCKGCGAHGVLASLQRVMRKNNMDPENVVTVSGIGCSSRMPHYLKTYGFHGIHGRALPIATGVRLARPELKVIVTMGDGDCFSIGGNHWLPAHLDETIERAWEHQGLSFVRILQRCPVFMPHAFGDGGLNFPLVFLENEGGIPINPLLLNRGKAQPHNQRNINEAQRMAAEIDPAPMGLIYHNPDIPIYEEVRFSRRNRPDPRVE